MFATAQAAAVATASAAKIPWPHIRKSEIDLTDISSNAILRASKASVRPPAANIELLGAAVPLVVGLAPGTEGGADVGAEEGDKVGGPRDGMGGHAAPVVDEVVDRIDKELTAVVVGPAGIP